MAITSGRVQAFGALLIALLAAFPAQAALTDTVSVSLEAPGGFVGNATPIDATSMAPLATGVTPQPGLTPSDVGYYMLSAESITFDSADNRLVLKIAAGEDDLSTGYLGSGANPAQYVFTGLGVLGATITGYTASFTGLAAPMSPSAFIHLLSPTSLSVELDNLVMISNPAGDAFGLATVDIDLMTQAVPEPASWALALAGLLFFARTRRAR